MRLVIDMQGAQTPFSRHRGVGRYTTALVKALAQDTRGHEIILALNGAFGDAIDSIRATFQNILPQSSIHVWQQFYDCSAISTSVASKRWAAEISREAFLNSFGADVIFSTNLQEGLFDPAPTSVKHLQTSSLVCTTLHDVIPLVYPEIYLESKVIRKWYEEKIDGVRKSDFVLTVSENSRREIIELVGIPADRIAVIYNAVDRSRFFPRSIDPTACSELYSSLGITKPFVLYAGGSDIHKNLDRMLEAFARLPMSVRDSHQLLLVGKEPKSNAARHLRKLECLGIDDHVIFAGYIDDISLSILYSLCSLFVFPSIHEGFGLPPLEAMAAGAVVIAANTSSLPEVIGLDDALFDPLDVDAMSKMIERGLTDRSFREHLAAFGATRASTFSWETSASNLWDLFERFTAEKIRFTNFQKSVHQNEWGDSLDQENPVKVVIDGIASHPSATHLEPEQLGEIAASLDETYPYSTDRPRRIFLDVSALIQDDSRTGIQRVVRSICCELIKDHHSDLVLPVFSSPGDNNFYIAGSLVDEILGNSDDTTREECIKFRNSDLLLYLDLHPSLAISHTEHTKYLRNKGICVWHVVYDLIPETHPEFFWPEVCSEFSLWLRAIANADGAVCISNSVANDLRSWMASNNVLPRARSFEITYFHLGADMMNSVPTRGIPLGATKLLDRLCESTSFLMVSRIEPRKGHAQTLSAFEQLWDEGSNINLIIVGKQGWKVDALVNKIRKHRELGSRLFWLEDVSDEYLEKIYAASKCLISASEAEGFGLPLIEAAWHKLPIIARDIPVFREVAADHAFYFANLNDPSVLASAISEWLGLYYSGKQPKSGGISRKTWGEAANELLKVIREANTFV